MLRRCVCGGGLSAVASAWGKSHQMLVCGNVKVLASHIVVQKHASFLCIPPQASAVNSYLLFFFFSELEFFDFLAIFWVGFFPRLLWPQIASSCWHFTLIFPSALHQLHGHTNSPISRERLSMAESSGAYCVSASGPPPVSARLTLGHCANNKRGEEMDSSPGR